MLFRNKSKCFYLLCLLATSTQVDGSLNEWDWNIKTQKADQLFHEGLYQDAIPIYVQAIHSFPYIENLAFNHLAICYLEMDSSQAALNLLAAHSPFPIKDSSHFFFKSVCYRRLNQFQAALNILKHLKEAKNLDNRIIFETGLNFYHSKQFEAAQHSFQSIKWDFQAPSLYFFAQLYSARLYILQNQPKLAQQVLKNFSLPIELLKPAQDSNLDLKNSELLLLKLKLERDYLLGVCSYSLQNYQHASIYFQLALQKTSSTQSALVIPALRQLISCYLCQANEMTLKSKQRNELFNQARASIKKLMALSREEKDYFLLGDFYLSLAYFLQNKKASLKAEELFKRKDLFSSTEGQVLATLKRVESLTGYSERSEQFKILTRSNPQDSLISKCWYHRACNEFKEGIFLLNHQSPMAASYCFNEAFHSFLKTFTLTFESQPEHACPILKNLILTSILQPFQSSISDFEVLKCNAQVTQDLIEQHAFVLSDHQNWAETLYLLGVLWEKIALKDPAYLPFAEKNLKQASSCSTNKKWLITSLLELGSLYFHQEKWGQAESTFFQISQRYPNCSKALFWQALCAEKKLLPDRKLEILTTLYMNDPQGPLAPFAYFYVYSYQEYLHGNRKSIKHLKAMPALFPKHPLTINAHYLIGLDYKKDHLSKEGKILKGANLMEAIEAFQQAETLYDDLSLKVAFPPQTFSYYLTMRYKCTLERALANFSLAKESHGPKQQIYFEYAGQVFEKLIEDLNCHLENPSLEQIWAEATYKYAQTYLKKSKEKEAEKVLDQLIAHYQKKSLSHGYILTKAWSQKGKIAFNRQDFSLALIFFQNAENTSQEQPFLSPDQKINLWIEQSACCKEMGQWDQAMLHLSKAVNHDVISGLRLKAMYLRVDLYELQNRPELALKQLKAIARKGGVWGNKAKTKLKEKYGV